MAATKISTTENLRIYNSTIRENSKDLNAINKKQKLSLILFFIFFTAKYKSLMSELSNE